jgi:uncharacterized protein YidB (DUF937 family)
MMSRGFPSMTALLALLAVAGYQNRDKISEMLKGSGHGNQPGTGNLGSILSGLGGAGAGGLLGGGLSELIERFKQSGQEDVAESWVKSGPNKPCTKEQLRSTLGPDVLGNLVQQTGLTEDELVSRLCKTLPEAVDKYTPEGRLPAAA